MELKRIDVLSCAKIAALLYAVMGFIGGALFSLLTLAGAVGSAASDADFPMAGFALGAGAVVCAPVVYGVIGGIFAAVGAALYNLFAGMVGGIRIELGER